MEEDFYTVDEAARILRLTPGRIRQMLRAGELASNALVSDWFSCILSAGVARAGAPPLDPAPASTTPPPADACNALASLQTGRAHIGVRCAENVGGQGRRVGRVLA